MKATRRLFCVVLIALMLVLFSVPASAIRASDIDWGSSTIYLTGKHGSYYGHQTINIYNLEHFILEKGALHYESSDKKVITIRGVEGWGSQTVPISAKNGQDLSGYHSGSISLEARKEGKATIRIDIDGTVYSNKYRVVSYVNPVKSFILSGQSRDNLKNAFNLSNSASGKLTPNSKSKEGFLVVTPASGWKVTSLYWGESGKYAPYGSLSTGRGASSAKLFIPSLLKGHRYYVGADFVNTRTKGTQSATYWID